MQNWNKKNIVKVSTLRDTLQPSVISSRSFRNVAVEAVGPFETYGSDYVMKWSHIRE
jgi:hypothetical protein